MPELLTKYPDVAKKVLESGGARCGGEQKPQILVDCPAASFCSLPGGELCLYGLEQTSAMTQISEAELCPTRATEGSGCQLGSGAPITALGIAVVALALLAARRKTRSPR